MRKKLFAAIFSLLLALTLGSCAEKDDYGDIQEIEIPQQEEESDEPEEESELNPQPTSLDYEWAYENIGRACLSLPYPKSWTVEKETDYDICFAAPSDDSYFPGGAVYFHSTLESGDIEDIHQLYKKTFAAKILQDRFPYKSSYIQLGYAAADKSVVNTKVSEPELNYQIAFKDWDAYATERGTGEASGNFYHQATCFYWRHYPCVLTGLVDEKKADQLDDLLTYMMSNSKYIFDRTKSVREVTVFPKTTGLTFPISTRYEQVDADPGNKFEKATGFACPVDSGTGYSQSSLFIYETDSNGFDATLEDFEQYKSIIIRNASGIENPAEQTEGYMKSDSGYVDFATGRQDEYVYEFSVTDTKNLPKGCFAGQIWRAEMFALEHDGKTDLVVICAPTDGLIWAIDLTKLMAGGITYK